MPAQGKKSGRVSISAGVTSGYNFALTEPRIPKPDLVAGPKLAFPHLNLQILCARLPLYVERQEAVGPESLQHLDVVVVAARLREVDAEQQLWHRLEHAWRVDQAAQCLRREVVGQGEAEGGVERLGWRFGLGLGRAPSTRIGSRRSAAEHRACLP